MPLKNIGTISHVFVNLFRKDVFMLFEMSAFDVELITVSLFVSIKRKFLGYYSFSEQVATKGNSSGLLDKYNHLFICISLK